MKKTLRIVTIGTALFFAISLTQNPAKETWTNGNVTVEVSSDTSIKEAKWVRKPRLPYKHRAFKDNVLAGCNYNRCYGKKQRNLRGYISHSRLTR